MKKQKLELMVKETYLAAIKNSVNSKMFRNIYMKIGNKQTDITENGNLSCAFYVSSVLVLMKFIKEVHATVNGTVKDMIASGWTKLKKPKIGSVIVWESIDFGLGEAHSHVGFYIGGNKAISNDFKKKSPVTHNMTFNGKRKIASLWWHKSLK